MVMQDPKLPDPADKEIYLAIKNNWDSIAKPLDGLGIYEGIIAKTGMIQRTEMPSVKNRTLLIFLSDNGIVEEGVSQCGP